MQLKEITVAAPLSENWERFISIWAALYGVKIQDKEKSFLAKALTMKITEFNPTSKKRLKRSLQLTDQYYYVLLKNLRDGGWVLKNNNLPIIFRRILDNYDGSLQLTINLKNGSSDNNQERREETE